MERENIVYITALQDSLKSKYAALEKILELTKEQEAVLSKEEFDMDAFEALIEPKGILIEQIQELDNGFESVYAKVGADLKKRKQEYKPRILEMQNLLRQITELGVKIQALEQKNRQRFEIAAAKKKQEIQGFRMNNRTAGAYSRHMANQHSEGQSYFLDKKK